MTLHSEIDPNDPWLGLNFLDPTSRERIRRDPHPLFDNLRRVDPVHRPVPPPRERVGRQRHLTVAALHLQPALDDGVLALRRRPLGAGRHWNVEAQSMVLRAIVF